MSSDEQTELLRAVMSLLEQMDARFGMTMLMPIAGGIEAQAYR